VTVETSNYKQQSHLIFSVCKSYVKAFVFTWDRKKIISMELCDLWYMRSASSSSSPHIFFALLFSLFRNKTTSKTKQW